GQTDRYRCHRYTRSISVCERDRRTRHRHTPERVSRPPDRPRRAPLVVGASGIRHVLQPRASASHAQVADAPTETATGNRPDPVAAGAERFAPRLRTRCLSTTDVLPSHTPKTRLARATEPAEAVLVAQA